MNNLSAGKSFSIAQFLKLTAKGVSILLASVLMVRPCFAAGDMLSLNPDPQSVAMGGGLTAQKSSLPSGAFNNPASLTGMIRPIRKF